MEQHQRRSLTGAMEQHQRRSLTDPLVRDRQPLNLDGFQNPMLGRSAVAGQGPDAAADPARGDCARIRAPDDGARRRLTTR